MKDNSNMNILNSVFCSIRKFQQNTLSVGGMISNISANIPALDGVCTDFIGRFQGFVGEIDFIRYTEEQDVIYELVLQEVNDYEKYLKKYFAEIHK